MLNRSTGDFDFYPGWFLEPYKAEIVFKEQMCNTQIFVSFVEAKRKEDMMIEKERKEVRGRGAERVAKRRVGNCRRSILNPIRIVYIRVAVSS